MIGVIFRSQEIGIDILLVLSLSVGVYFCIFNNLIVVLKNLLQNTETSHARF